MEDRSTGRVKNSSCFLPYLRESRLGRYHLQQGLSGPRRGVEQQPQRQQQFSGHVAAVILPPGHTTRILEFFGAKCSMLPLQDLIPHCARENAAAPPLPRTPHPRPAEDTINRQLIKYLHY